MRNLKKIIKEKIDHHFHEVLKLKKSPFSIAIGFAIGTFISILPTPGFNILFGVIIVLIFERISKISLFGAMAVFNPLTTPLTYWLSYRIGNLIFGSLPVVTYEIPLIDQIYNFSRRFLIGNLLLAITISITSYFIVFFIAKHYKKKHKDD